MEYKKIIEKVIEQIGKNHIYENITVSVDNSKRLTVSEKKQTVCPDESMCHMSENENLDLCSEGRSDTKLYPEEKEEVVETPFYRIDIICDATSCDKAELFGYRAFVSVDKDNNINIIQEAINPIVNSADAKVYEELRVPTNPEEKQEISVQAYVMDSNGIGGERTYCDESGYPVYIYEEHAFIDKNGETHTARRLYTDIYGRTYTVKENYTNRGGELCAFTFKDNMAHVFAYDGNFGGKSATEDNVFFTFEDHTIHKYTLETAVDTNHHFVNGYIHLYDGHISLRDEIYYKVPLHIEQHGNCFTDQYAIGDTFSGLKVVQDPTGNSKMPFQLGIMQYNPMILDVNFEQRVMIKNGDEEPILSEPYDKIEFVKEPISHPVKTTLHLGTMPIEDETMYTENALAFKCTKDNTISSLYLIEKDGKPSFVKQMELKMKVE